MKIKRINGVKIYKNESIFEIWLDVNNGTKIYAGEFKVRDETDKDTTLKQIQYKLKEYNIPVETFVEEFERLKKLEDNLTQPYINGFDDGRKDVEDEIRRKLREYRDFYNKYLKEKEFEKCKIEIEKILTLEELLKEVRPNKGGK